MSGKFADAPRSRPKLSKKARTHRFLLGLNLVLSIILILEFGWLLQLHSRQAAAGPTGSTQPSAPATPSAGSTAGTQAATEPAQADGFRLPWDLGNGLQILNLGSYTGMYMEDGTDDIVTNVLMVIVTNTGDTTLQYAQLSLTCQAGEALFSLSTLPPGASVVLLEQNRMAYDHSMEISSAAAENVVFFSQEPSLQPESLQLQIQDGSLNVTNISGGDISGDIVIYYKNSAMDLLYGGITYRARIEGGLQAGQTQQLAAPHLREDGSQILLVTIG